MLRIDHNAPELHPSSLSPSPALISSKTITEKAVVSKRKPKKPTDRRTPHPFPLLQKLLEILPHISPASRLSSRPSPMPSPPFPPCCFSTPLVRSLPLSIPPSSVEDHAAPLPLRILSLYRGMVPEQTRSALALSLRYLRMIGRLRTVILHPASLGYGILVHGHSSG